jgi:hypothetical protein
MVYRDGSMYGRSHASDASQHKKGVPIVHRTVGSSHSVSRPIFTVILSYYTSYCFTILSAKKKVTRDFFAQAYIKYSTIKRHESEEE